MYINIIYENLISDFENNLKDKKKYYEVEEEEEEIPELILNFDNYNLEQNKREDITCSSLEDID